MSKNLVCTPKDEKTHTALEIIPPNTLTLVRSISFLPSDTHAVSEKSSVMTPASHPRAKQSGGGVNVNYYFIKKCDFKAKKVLPAFVLLR